MTLRMGQVAWFDPTKGIGFISPVDGSAPVYVNRLAIATAEKRLTKGQQVEFSTYNSSRGLTASDVIVF